MVSISETKDAGLLALLNEEVQNLHSELYPEMFKPYDKVAITTAIGRFLNEDYCRAFVAYDSEIPVGYALFFIREVNENAFQFASKTLYLDQIAVLSQYRNKGIGELLMDQAEILANQLSISKIELDHWSTNTVAAKYFRNKGYSLYKERLYKKI